METKMVSFKTHRGYIVVELTYVQGQLSNAIAFGGVFYSVQNLEAHWFTCRDALDLQIIQNVLNEANHVSALGQALKGLYIRYAQSSIKASSTSIGLSALIRMLKFKYKIQDVISYTELLILPAPLLEELDWDVF